MTDKLPTWGTVPPGDPRRIHASPRRTALQPDWVTIRARLRPIATWRLEVGRFEFNSSFVSPRAREEIADLARLHRLNPESPISLFGHSDPTGDDEYNKVLSGRRVLALHGALTRDVGRWEALWIEPLAGDAWGTHELQAMLATLPGGDTLPYYAGPVDGIARPAFTDAVAGFQAGHSGPNGEPLAVDGQPGPLTRAALFRAYMDWLCTSEDGGTIELVADDFLARGSDPDLRGDVQGCGELNPRRVFSTAEAEAYQAWDQKEARDEDNAVNRRIVAFLYEPGMRVDPNRWWPCPAARSGLVDCRKRLWSDAEARRNPSERRREFDGDYDTFGCRFYHYFALDTPAETPVHVGRSFDLYLHDGIPARPIGGRFRLVSSDGEVAVTLSDADAITVRDGPAGRVRCLRFEHLRPGKTYALSREDADPKTHKPLALLEAFTLEELFAQGQGRDPEQDARPVPVAPLRPEPEPTTADSEHAEWKQLNADWYEDR